MKKKLQVLFFCFLSLNFLVAQEQKMCKGTLTNYSGKLYDSGGENGNYGNNENITQTIYSDNGQSPYISFTKFNTESNFDILYIYDGPDAQSKLIGAYSNGIFPGTLTATGAYLTLVFTSDASNTLGGWIAIVGRGQTPLPPVPTGSDCATADPFCTGVGYTFPASTSTTSQTGPAYGCLSTQPNPAWYYMQVATSGTITIDIAGTGGFDVDFICWGPFTSPTAPCGAGLTSGSIIDCSYSSSATETCTVNNAVAGQFYMLLITNFSGQPQNITFGSDPNSTGSTNCGIVCGLTASSTGPYCIGETIDLNSTLVTAATYTWTGPGGYTANGQNVTIPNATVGMSGTYTITATNANGPCTATVFVSVSAGPTVSITSSPTICAGATTTLTAAGGTSYTWAPGGATTNTISVSPPSTTVYSVSGTTGNCPVTSATTTVTVTTPATIVVNSATICPTTSATLTANGSVTYNWSPPTGLSATTGASVTASPPSTTVYTVSGGACVIPGTCTVTVSASCSITVNSATICPNATATLTANGGGPYTWSPAIGLSATSGAVVTANPPSTIVYTVTSASATFTSTATSTVVVNASPTITVNNATICEGTSTSLISHGASTYSWAPATGLSATTASAVVASPTITTTYTIIGTAVNTCTNSTIATIGVNPMPTVSVTPTSSSGCAPLCVNYTSASSTSSLNYSWNFGDGGSSDVSNPTNCFRVKGTYTATLTLTDGNGCKGKAISTATVYPQPHADFGASPQPVSIIEPTIQFTDLTTNGPIVKWNWNFGAWGSGDTSHVKNPAYTYQDTGYFIVNLWVSTAFGCKDSAVKIIKIDDDYELFVPSAFSPNGDGINEYFLPVSRGVMTSNYHLYLYDRWGNLIFQTDNLNKGWDGTIHGITVLEDVFVWKILLKTTNGSNKQVHGQVSVVK